MVRLQRGESDALGNAFIHYLDNHNLKRTTSKPELKGHYINFLSVKEAHLGRTSFSQILYHMSRRQRQIQIHYGFVYFKGTADWNQSKMKFLDINPNPQIRSQRDEVFRILNSSKARDSLLHSHENSVNIKCDTPGVEDTFGYYMLDVQDGAEFEIHVHNVGFADVTLRKCLFLRDSRVMSLSDEHGCTRLPDPESVLVHPGESYPVTITCKLADDVASYCSDIFFTFSDSLTNTFVVMRYLRCVKSDDITKLLGPVSPYCRRQAEARVCFSHTLPGEKIELSSACNRLKFKRVLEKCEPSKDLRESLRCGAFDTGDNDKMKPPRTRQEKDWQDLLNAKLTYENYGKRFSLLLHLEELQAERDIHVYDLKKVTMEKERRKFVLKVPGLAERRPSILRGDKIFFSKVGPDGKPFENTRYGGYVHDVRLNEVLIGLNWQLASTFVPGMKFNVTFTFNRLPLKLQHRAVLNIKDETKGRYEKCLFPEIVNDLLSPAPRLRIANRLIETNPEQRRAIESIFYGNTRCPYIIFGPPGTGKTVTVVEAVYQIVHAKPDARLLICAPSNSACDLLVERLLKFFDKAWIYRMYAMSRPLREIPECVKPVSNFSAIEKDFIYPSVEDLKQYRVIATTLITAGRISSACFPEDHFDYIFVDEAGHAVEPELLIAVENILSPLGRLVIAGDPHQLGPIVRSSIAKRHGLDTSYLERLMNEQKIYEGDKDDPDEFDSRVITRLVRNYRSHEAIIHIPNELFYENALEVYADRFMRESCCNWEELPKKDFPIIFHGVKGVDMREGNSPSFFNPEEASMVFNYTKSLLDTRRNPVRPHEIGIISPYRKQVEKIRLAMEKKKLEGREKIKVGSVEEFQGQERRVIIISTVRSDSHNLIHDKRFHLGFLRNPKRFNVAITRAKALLIVIGNPGILCKDHYWKTFLDYCKENGGTKGIFYDRNDVEADATSGDEAESDDESDDVDELTKRMREIGLSNVQGIICPEWRNEM